MFFWRHNIILDFYSCNYLCISISSTSLLSWLQIQVNFCNLIDFQKSNWIGSRLFYEIRTGLLILSGRRVLALQFVWSVTPCWWLVKKLGVDSILLFVAYENLDLKNFILCFIFYYCYYSETDIAKL